jgi:hypothetical protein
MRTKKAKIKSSHGIIQGFDGVVVVHEKHQVTVHAEAFVAAQEHTTRVCFEATGWGQNPVNKEFQVAFMFYPAKAVPDASPFIRIRMKLIA